MNANNTNGRWLLHFPNGLISQFIRIPSTFIAIDRIENVTNLDWRVTTTADHGKTLALDEPIDDKLQPLAGHDLAPNMRELNRSS